MQGMEAPGESRDLQLPVMIGYKFNIGNHYSIKPSVGGYYAVGVGVYALIDGVDAFNQPYTERTSTFSGTNGTDAFYTLYIGAEKFPYCDAFNLSMSGVL